MLTLYVLYRIELRIICMLTEKREKVSDVPPPIPVEPEIGVLLG